MNLDFFLELMLASGVPELVCCEETLLCPAVRREAWVEILRKKCIALTSDKVCTYNKTKVCGRTFSFSFCVQVLGYAKSETDHLDEVHNSLHVLEAVLQLLPQVHRSLFFFFLQSFFFFTPTN